MIKSSIGCWMDWNNLPKSGRTETWFRIDFDFTRDRKSEEESTARDDVLNWCDRLGFYTGTLCSWRVIQRGWSTPTSRRYPPSFSFSDANAKGARSALGGHSDFHFYSLSLFCPGLVGTAGYCRETLCKNNNNNNNLESVSISFSRLVGEKGDGLAVFTTPYLLRLSYSDRPPNILLLAKRKTKGKEHACVHLKRAWPLISIYISFTMPSKLPRRQRESKESL
jgi:hypothetical protein